MAAIPVGLLEYNPSAGTKKVFPLYANGSGEDTLNANFVNTRSYNPISASVSGTEYQVFSIYDDPSEYLVIGIRSKTAGVWGSVTSYVYDGTGGRPTIQRSEIDNHNNIGLGVDPNGYLHISYDQHNVALLYRRSDAPLNTWTGGLTTELSMLGTNESTTSYPHFFNDPSGNLYFYHRDGGGSGQADSFIYKYTHGTTTWAALAGTTAGKVISGLTSSPDENAYPFNAPKFTSNFDGAGTGYMYMAWIWQVTTDPATRHDVSFVRWDGTNWTKSGGTSQTMPITHENADIIDAVAQNMNIRGGDALLVDSSHYPHLIYKQYVSASTASERYYHNWYDGSAWTKTTIDWGYANDYDFSIHDAVIDGDGQIYLVTTNKTMGNGVYCYTSPGTDWGKTWKLSTLTDEDVRIGADPIGTRAAIQIDPYQWRVNGVIHSLVPLAGAVDGATEAFPDQWDYADKATITNPSSDVDNPFFIIDLSTMTARFWANVQADLDDVRLSDGNGNMLPCYIHPPSLNYAGQQGMAFGRWVGTLDSAASQEVWIHYGNVSATTPAATHILGRNNCWRDGMLGIYLDGDGTDYSRVGNNLTGSGLPTEDQTGPFGTLKSTEFNGSSQYYSLTPATVSSAAPTTPCGFIVWYDADDATLTQTLCGLTDTADTDRFLVGQLRGATAGDPVTAAVNANGLATVFGDSASGYSTGVWQMAAYRFTSTTSRQGILNGVAGTAETTSRAPDSLDCVTFGALRRTTVSGYFDGHLSLGQFYMVGDFPTDAELAHQYAMANQATFWGAWADANPPASGGSQQGPAYSASQSALLPTAFSPSSPPLLMVGG